MLQSKTKKILYPIYHFLPCATTHIHRVLRFLNHLAETGKYDITVLTCKNPNDVAYDENLQKKLNSKIKVIRTNSIFLGIHNRSTLLRTYVKSKHHNKKNYFKELLRFLYRATFRELFNFVNVPDNSIGWFPFAFFKGKELLKRNNYDMIFVTGPPFSNFILAACLKNHHAKLIIDYRDPWKNNYYMEKNFRAKWQVNLSRWLERFVLKKTDLVIANTFRMRDFIVKENQGSFTRSNIKVEVIHNGFNYDNQTRREPVHNDKMTFLFTGRFHGERLNPKYLLQAMRELIDSGEMDKNKIKMVFLGNLLPSDFDRIAHIKTKDFCEFRGMVPHSENLKAIHAADCLVVISGTGTVDSLLVPSKIYEYLNTNNKILGLLRDGEARDILEKTGGAVLVSPDDHNQIKQGILQIYNDFHSTGNVLVERDRDYVLENFDAKNLCNRLDIYLGELF